MGIKVEGHTNLVRDEESHAIINTDVEQYRLTMRRRQIMRSQKDEINSLRTEITEIKDLLRELINKDG
tara:strand:+ start:429 stop:632 length:204 start_codon:yes stop_codon:yes gene_type:complete